MAVYPLLTEKQTFVDSNGNLLSGGKLFVYAANTQTKVTSYAETDGVSANSNPIVLNSRGEVPNGLYVSGGIQYKLVLAPATDTDPPTSPIWTRDDLEPLGYVAQSALSEWQSSGATATQTGATTFTVSGDQRGTFQIGRRVRAVITAAPQLTYGTVSAAVFGAGITTVTLAPLSTSLDSGMTGTIPDVGLLQADDPSVPALPDNVFTVFDNADKTKRIQFGIGSLTSFPTATTAVLDPPGYNAQLANVPIGSVMDYAGATAPTGWLICNGAAVSRTTYSVLFALIGSTYGQGDGSTTFNVPDLRGRMSIGAGAAVFAETVTASSGNGFTVASNVDGWLTGMPVVLSSLSGFTTSATAGPTYFVVRISATNICLATTLALAQNETPDVTISGSGSCVVTYTAASRALGSRGGQESKAMTINEMLSHNHPMSNSGAGGSGGNFAVDFSSSTIVTGPRGGNVAMPIMNPYQALNKIIRAL